MSVNVTVIIVYELVYVSLREEPYALTIVHYSSVWHLFN